MKKEEEKIDELIKEALSSEEAKFYDALGEQSLIEIVSKVYQGFYNFYFLYYSICENNRYSRINYLG
jgi:hypothetical protein